MERGWLALLLVCGVACYQCRAGRVAPDAVMDTVASGEALSTHTDAPAASDSIDFADGDDPSVKAHWALLVAGSAGWGNYRHQADVYHAYQILRNGGYQQDHIVVMAYDDIANNPENPMPGKVFNRPGGSDVYAGVPIDYRGEDVTAATFLAVLEGDAVAVANKGTGRVVASGPSDKVFLFYSDHGAAGVLGMPSGPFLYADELMKTLRKKFHKQGFKEFVMYIEACESGSMFEGLLDDNMVTYVTTAANAVESSWATYCPEFATATDSSSSSSSGALPAAGAIDGADSSSSSSSDGVVGWLMHGLIYVQQLLNSAFSLPPAVHSHKQPHSAAAAENLQGQPPAPQFYTCLGDLYSVSWMEDAEVSDLTHETLLQQYKVVKKRTSHNFTYEQGSHVMQYGALDIDREVAGDYEGMLHNGSVPPSPSFPSAEWLAFEDTQQGQQWRTSRHQQQQQQLLLQQYSSVSGLAARLAGPGSPSGTVQQRDADLLPLLHAAQHASCPQRRAAAAATLQGVTAARQSLEAVARAAVAELIKHPDVGHIMLTNLEWPPSKVLPSADPVAQKMLYGAQGDLQQQQQQVDKVAAMASAAAGAAAAGTADGRHSGGLLGDVLGSYVEALMCPLPGREGQALVDSWDCLRGMVQAWEGECGALDQYGMKQTRLFANLCNAGVEPSALAQVLGAGPCGA